MLTYRDCLDMAAVSEAECAAIAEHEHIPAMLALEKGEQLMATAAGRKRLQAMILEAIENAQDHSRCASCALFSRTLHDFIQRWTPPEAAGELLPPKLAEYLAIGLVEDAADKVEPSTPEHAACLAALEEAKVRNDCAACGAASLRLLKGLGETVS
ncbi:MAG TPA: hypothetical protein VKN76_18585 [Kiloniellaceae bacterium]|nr:hypothetical protein [Kiloniellaceae bacterium]